MTSSSSYKPVTSDFQTFHLIGEGSFAKVYMAVNRITNIFSALKVVDKEHLIRHHKVDTITTERTVLTTLRGHPGIINLYYTLQDQYALYFCMELCTGGELRDQIQHLKCLPLATARFYASEIAEIIHFIHMKGVLHRDLKPSNILLDARGHLKLCDFGSAKIVKPDELDIPSDLLHLLEQHDQMCESEPTSTSTALSLQNKNRRSSNASASSEFDFDAAITARYAQPTDSEFVGTAQYCYPEMLASHYLNYGADWWSFGVILYEMLVGTTPFYADTEYLIFQKLQNYTALDFPDDFDPQAKDLISRLLHPDPRQRLGIHYSQERDILLHPFLRSLWTQCHVDAVFSVQDKYRLELLQQEQSLPTTASTPSADNTTSSSQTAAAPSETTTPAATPLTTTNSILSPELLALHASPSTLDVTSPTSTASHQDIEPILEIDTTDQAFPEAAAENPQTPSTRIATLRKMIDAKPGSADFRQLLQQTKPLSIFSVKPPNFWRDETQRATINRTVNQYRETKQTSLKSENPDLPPPVVAPSVEAPASERGDLPQAPLRSSPSPSVNDRITPPNPNADSLPPSPAVTTTLAPANNPTTTQHNNSSTTAIITAAAVPASSPWDALGPVPRKTSHSQIEQRGSVSSNNDPSKAISPNGAAASRLQPFGPGLAESGRSTSNLHRITTRASGPILQAVVGQEYRPHFSNLEDSFSDTSRWDGLLRPGEFIVAMGDAWKGNRLLGSFFHKRRTLILTSQARLLIVNEDKSKQKEELLLASAHCKASSPQGLEVSSEAGGSTVRFTCEAAPSIALWFAAPHRVRAPKMSLTGDIELEDSITFVHSTMNTAFADHWKSLIDSVIVYNRTGGGVLGACKAIYQRQAFIQEHIRNSEESAGADDTSIPSGGKSHRQRGSIIPKGSAPHHSRPHPARHHPSRGLSNSGRAMGVSTGISNTSNDRYSAFADKSTSRRR